MEYKDLLINTRSLLDAAQEFVYKTLYDDSLLVLEPCKILNYNEFYASRTIDGYTVLFNPKNYTYILIHLENFVYSNVYFKPVMTRLMLELAQRALVTEFDNYQSKLTVTTKYRATIVEINDIEKRQDNG